MKDQATGTPTYLLSADGFTRVFLQSSGYTGAGPRPSSASQSLSDDINISQGPNGGPAHEGVPLTQVQLKPVRTSSAGPFDQIAEQDYTALVSGEPVHGIYQEFLITQSGTGAFLQSLSTNDVTTSAGVMTIIQSLEASNPSP
jgi:hypothetical protein